MKKVKEMKKQSFEITKIRSMTNIDQTSPSFFKGGKISLKKGWRKS
jgi:hypothetical protein